MNGVLSMAYDAFPPLIKKWRQSYQDPGSNLPNWFRFYWPSSPSHTHNWPKWLQDPDADHAISMFIPNASYEDLEGIHLEVEWRFSGDANPLNGPCLVQSRDRGDTIQVGFDGSEYFWVTNTVTSGAWPDATSWSPQYFYILPKSVADMQSAGHPADEVSFVVLPGQMSCELGTGLWSTVLNNVCCMRDQGSVQSSWVKNIDPGTYPPGQDWTTAPS